jgi:coatomer subunit beta
MNSNLNRAVEYCLSIEDKISFMGDLFQLAFLELTRRVLYIDTNLANSLLPMVTTLVNSSISPALIYEGASTLLLFPSSPVAVETATRAYILLLCREGDNNVKLSVLDCLDEILLTFPSALENFAVDIFRALSSPSLEIKKKTLAIGFKLVNKRTAHVSHFFDIKFLFKKKVIRIYKRHVFFF